MRKVKQWLTFNLRFVAFLFLLVLFTIRTADAGDRLIGGYVDNADARFVRNVWNFIKNFQGWQNVGGNRWEYSQYYWADPVEFNSQHLNYVDKMDFAYFSGHGNHYYCQTNASTSTGFDLRSCPGFGNLATGGHLKFLIIESCYTVTTCPDVAGDWWTPWGSSIFQGLHQLVGFHTLSNSDNGIPNNFAGKLKANGGIWQSWFNAVNEERSWINNPTNSDGSPYPGLASTVLYTSTQNETLGNYGANPAGGTGGMYTYWQY